MATELLSARELEVWNAFKHMGEAVLNRVRRDIADATGLSGADFGVLSHLADLGDGEMRQQQLADSMDWDKGRLSHHLTRMQERGLIKKRPAGNRSTIVAITKTGSAKLRAARPVHAASIRRNLLKKMTPAQLTLILRVAAQVADVEPEE
jgi:DNA-binding MarR family transcriptional regulator